MTSFIFISIPIFVLVFYVILKFLKRGNEKINDPNLKRGKKCDDIDAPSPKVNDSLEKAEEVERIEFERENEKKLNESQPENIPCNIYLQRKQDEIPFSNEEVKENFLEKFDGNSDNVEMPLKENYENILPEENVINPEDLLNRFTGYIYRNKLAKIEDISISLKSDIKETVNKLRDIEIQGNTTGFLDEKGFYVSLNERELDV